MKGIGVALAVVISVILQVTLARYTVGGRWVFDFVLVGVVYAALQWGPVSGLMAGTLGGLLQDVLAGQIVGVGGLAKSVVGFAAGIVGTQFVLTRPQARTIIVVDKQGKVAYVQVVPEVTQEPDYDAVMGAVKKAAG